MMTEQMSLSKNIFNVYWIYAILQDTMLAINYYNNNNNNLLSSNNKP